MLERKRARGKDKKRGKRGQLSEIKDLQHTNRTTVKITWNEYSMMRNVGFYSHPMWVCVCVCMHAWTHLCVFYTHVALKASGEKSLQGKNKSLSFWQLSFSFPTPYSSTHASCSPGNDWLLGLVSQLHVCMFNSPFLSLSSPSFIASHSSSAGSPAPHMLSYATDQRGKETNHSTWRYHSIS